MQQSSEQSVKAVPARRRGWFARFLRDTRGVTAIEFSAVALPFFMVLFSMFEVGITFTANTVLQNAVYEAARQVRTGQIQMSGQADKAKVLRDVVCDNLVAVVTCGDKLRLEVRPFSGAEDAKCDPPLLADGSFRSNYAFRPGEPGDFILVCAFYKWETFTPGLGHALAAVGPGGYILESSAAVRNEPYKGAI